MPEQKPDVVLGEIEKGHDTKIVIAVRQFKGREYVDLREWWKPQGQDYFATKKGFTLASEPHIAGDLMEILEKVKQFLEGDEAVVEEG